MPKSKSSDFVAPPVSASDACELLSIVTSQDILSASMADRRKIFLAEFGRLIQADLGVWTWGRGFSVDGGITPMALVDHGMTDAQKAAMAKIGLDRSNDVEFRALVIQKMNAERHVALMRRDLYSDAAWKRRPSFRRLAEALGMDSWLVAIRYVRSDTWVNITFWRKPDREELGPRERGLLDLAIRAISWLHPTIAESVPPETFVGLTPRQRAVLILLLDGMSRKAAAKHLGLTEHTVGDHIKSIYENFQVHSLGELVARILKSG